MNIKKLMTQELIDNIKKPEATGGYRNRNGQHPENARTLNRIYVYWDRIIDESVLKSWNVTPEQLLELWEDDGAYGGYSGYYDAYQKGDFYKTDKTMAEHNAAAICWNFGEFFVDKIMPYTVVVEKDGYSFDTQWGDDPVPLDIALEIIKHHIPKGSINPGNYIEFNTQFTEDCVKEEWFIELWDKNKDEGNE